MSLDDEIRAGANADGHAIIEQRPHEPELSGQSAAPDQVVVAFVQAADRPVHVPPERTPVFDPGGDGLVRVEAVDDGLSERDRHFVPSRRLLPARFQLARPWRQAAGPRRSIAAMAQACSAYGRRSLPGTSVPPRRDPGDPFRRRSRAARGSSLSACRASHGPATRPIFEPYNLVSEGNVIAAVPKHNRLVAPTSGTLVTEPADKLSDRPRKRKCPRRDSNT